MPVNDKGSSSVILSTTGETVTLNYYTAAGVLTADAGEAAGVAVVGKLAHDNIKNALGNQEGNKDDTSLSFTSTALTTEVNVPWNSAHSVDGVSGLLRLTKIVENLSNGQYFVDYTTGTIYGKKASTATTLTSTAYKTLDKTAVISTGDVEIGAVELKNSNTDDRANVLAANTARTTGTIVLATQPIDAAGNVLGRTAANTARTTATLVDPVQPVGADGVILGKTPTTLTGGAKTVTTAGTGEALGATLACLSVYIRAKSTNTGNAYIGDSAVDKTSSKQIILAANDAVTLRVADRATVFVDVDTNGEGVDYLVMS